MAIFTPHTGDETRQMLGEIGVASVDELFADIPSALAPKSFELPAGMTENEATAYFTGLAGRNRTDCVSFVGGGYYDHFIPAAVDAITSRSEFVTAYTPYQPEASQGTLRSIFEYQSMISGITGLDYANASLYDGGTALYEAIAMAVRANGRRRVVIDGGVNPLFRRIVKTYAINIDIEIIEIDCKEVSSDRERLQSMLDDTVAALVVQNPNFFGTVDDYEDLFSQAREKDIVSILSFYPLSLGVLKSPGEMKADIAVGEGQSLGMPLSFGGPYLGLMAVDRRYVRKMPGRIVGETSDRNGTKSYVLTLQAREQHIRREKASSNICSNQALCALRAVVYLSLLGKKGFRTAAIMNMERAEDLRQALRKVRGIDVIKARSFNEFTVVLPGPAHEFAKKMLAEGIAAGVPASLFYGDRPDQLIVSATEKRSAGDIDRFVSAARKVLS